MINLIGLIRKRNLFSFLVSSLFIIISSGFSCQKANEVKAEYTSISVEASTYDLSFDSNKSVTLTVKSNTGDDITDMSSIYMDNEKIESNPITISRTGTFEIYAKYNDLTSSKIYVKNIDTLTDTTTPTDTDTTPAANMNTDASSNTDETAPNSYTAKVLIEDYTGSWCGNCPVLGYTIKELQGKNPKIIAVDIHINENSSSNLYNRYALTLASRYRASNTVAVINREPLSGSYRYLRFGQTSDISASEAQVNQLLGQAKNVGLAINSSLSGNNIEVKVKVGFGTDQLENAKLVVFLLEDGVIFPQANYYSNRSNSPLFQKGNPITTYEHNDTMRATFTDIFGDTIPQDKIAKNSVYQFSYTGTLPSTVLNKNKLKIVAFVLGGSNEAVINVQRADVGQDVDFD